MSQIVRSWQETQPEAREPLEVRRLLRGLLDELEGEEREDRVVLDLVLDGFRCVVTRVAEEPVTAGLQLSPREMEIARMVAKGHPNKAIAAVLEISSWTVSTHLRRMFAKLGVSSRAAMVARVLEQKPPAVAPERREPPVEACLRISG
jgi:DNA-binding CsgD family transcriptional regulator